MWIVKEGASPCAPTAGSCVLVDVVESVIPALKDAQRKH